ncbi:MAG TPA: choice-of-anchor tandem repeat GloVer-containing protein [Terriglobales bacterium]|nr:choice-of-anchor tandem repeat GloVer-containing protein [Terriglobales bacterium]
MSKAVFVSIVLLFCLALAIASPAQTLTTLVSFTGSSGSDLGANPESALVQGIDGNFYGTTVNGGTGGCGTVFNISPSGTLATLYSFQCGNDGANPRAGLVQGTDGNFYGTTSAGGTNSNGTVFRIPPGGGLPTTLYSFTGGADGSTPKGALVQAGDGNFYGTTSSGGANGDGTVFQISPGGTLTTLHSFSGADGAGPGTGLILANDGNLYGTTKSGGANSDGTIFKISLGGTFTTLHSFAGADGATPGASLLQASDGNLYGTTRAGGANNDGTVFRISIGGGLTTLYSFCSEQNCNDGNQPRSGLVQATDGNFYGTTELGGSSNAGTIFEITPAGTLTTLHSFSGGDGANPGAALVEGTDGYFYGTTYNGGTNSDGTVFQLNTGLNPYIIAQPSSGTIGSQVNILGTNLSGATAVFFNGTQAQILNNTSSLITTTVPAGATTGIVHVQIGGPGDTVNTYLDFQVTGPMQFVPVTPCRLLDTRQGNPILGGTMQSYTIQNLNANGPCGSLIPTNAAAYSLNVSVVPRGPLGYLTIWPQGEIQPFVATLNSLDGRIKGNAAIVPGGNNAVSVYVTDTTDVILDINGYFAAAVSGSLQFYSLTPCRVVDTRDDNMPDGLGPPALVGQQARAFPVLSSSCLQNLPQQAVAYSFSAAVVPNPPGQPLDYLTLYPSNQLPPYVSTLNNPTATVVANAALVQADPANGNISAFAYNSTDLVIDVNGYFAAPGGQNALSLYPVTPCRAFDTRTIGSGQPFQGVYNDPNGINVTGSSCAPPASAQAFVLNATVVPSGVMPYLTLWPQGTPQPYVSTLNAYDGAITNDMAIVPTNNGSIEAYAAGLTQLILDISGYFAP